MSTDDLIAVVKAAGYDARLPRARRGRRAARGRTDPGQALRQRLLVSAALSLPVVVLAMVPAWQFTYWQWASLTLAAPVVVWGAYPFHRAAWTNLRHGVDDGHAGLDGGAGGVRLVPTRCSWATPAAMTHRST